MSISLWGTVSLSVCLFPQDFALYLRRRAARPPLIIEGFDPASVLLNRSPSTWVNLEGSPASPPPLNRLPEPADVLSGAALPNFDDLRLRDPDTFRCGNLHQFAHTWDSLMAGVGGYGVIRPWIHSGVHIPSFFSTFRGFL